MKKAVSLLFIGFIMLTNIASASQVRNLAMGSLRFMTTDPIVQGYYNPA